MRDIIKCLNCGKRFYASRSDQLYCSPKCRYKYSHNSDLILPVKKCWYDMELEGIKTDEYREIKPYWTKRFENYFGRHLNTEKIKDIDGNIPTYIWTNQSKPVIYRNGYGNNVPSFTAICTISEGYGKEEWGAEEGVKYYILTIKRIIKGSD